jgi:hypothetical protein
MWATRATALQLYGHGKLWQDSRECLIDHSLPHQLSRISKENEGGSLNIFNQMSSICQPENITPLP